MHKALNKTASRLLTAYYRAPNHPMKLRWWGWVRRGLGYPRLTIPYGQGGWLTVDERDNLQREILSTGFYEPEVWNTLAGLASSDEVVWDVGGHVGAFAVRALTDPRVREVHVFEPHPIQAEVLAYNLALNKGRHHLHRVALGDRDEKRTLHNALYPNTGGSTFEIDPRDGRYEGSFETTCKRIDTLVFSDKVPAPTLMKVDIERWEYPLFLGAQRMLKEAPPKAIVFEAEMNARGDFEDTKLAELLQGNGYRIRWMKRVDGHIWLRENFLATRT